MGKHWPSMTQDAYVSSVFPQPLVTAYRKQKNISDFLIRSKLPPKEGSYPKIDIPGIKKCGKSCLICPFKKVGKNLKDNDFTWLINKFLHCKSDKNIIYMRIIQLSSH